MSISYPSNLDNITSPVAGQTEGVSSRVSIAVGGRTHAQMHADENAAILALETKVGVDNSAVTTTHDYKLSGVATGDKATSLTGSETLTNKTLTAPIIGVIKPDATHTLTLPVVTDTLITGSSPTLTTPFINDFTNANHDHSSIAKGGQLNATTAFSTGIMPTTRLASGNANSSTFLRGDQTWQAITSTIFIFGDGSDGTINLNGTNTFSFLTKSGNDYTMTRDFYATTLTIGSGVQLFTNGYKIYCTISINGTGTVIYATPNNGADGTEGFPGSDALGGVAISSTGWFKNQAGGNSGTSITGSYSIGGKGGNGGGTTSTSTSATILPNKSRFNALMGVDSVYGTPASFYPYLAGTSGSGGSNVSGGGGAVAHGGGGGSSGGIIFIATSAFDGSFTIKSLGGNGGNGAQDGGRGIGGGGGGGGCGGCSIIIFNSKSWSGTYLFTGGTGGLGLPYGVNGANGTTGTAYEINSSLV